MLWPSYFFITKTTPATLNGRLTFRLNDEKQSWLASAKTRRFISYPQIINFLLKTYMTSEGIEESSTAHFTQQLQIVLTQYSKALLAIILYCGDTNKKYLPGKISIKVPSTSIQHDVWMYWKATKEVVLHDFILANRKFWCLISWVERNIFSVYLSKSCEITHFNSIPRKSATPSQASVTAVLYSFPVKLKILTIDVVKLNLR